LRQGNWLRECNVSSLLLRKQPARSLKASQQVDKQG